MECPHWTHAGNALCSGDGQRDVLREPDYLFSELVRDFARLDQIAKVEVAGSNPVYRS